MELCRDDGHFAGLAQRLDRSEHIAEAFAVLVSRNGAVGDVEDRVGREHVADAVIVGRDHPVDDDVMQIGRIERCDVDKFDIFAKAQDLQKVVVDDRARDGADVVAEVEHGDGHLVERRPDRGRTGVQFEFVGQRQSRREQRSVRRDQSVRGDPEFGAVGRRAVIRRDAVVEIVDAVGIGDAVGRTVARPGQHKLDVFRGGERDVDERRGGAAEIVEDHRARIEHGVRVVVVGKQHDVALPLCDDVRVKVPKFARLTAIPADEGHAVRHGKRGGCQLGSDGGDAVRDECVAIEKAHSSQRDRAERGKRVFKFEEDVGRVDHMRLGGGQRRRDVKYAVASHHAFEHELILRVCGGHIRDHLRGDIARVQGQTIGDLKQNAPALAERQLGGRVGARRHASLIEAAKFEIELPAVFGVDASARHADDGRVVVVLRNAIVVLGAQRVVVGVENAIDHHSYSLGETLSSSS